MPRLEVIDDTLKLYLQLQSERHRPGGCPSDYLSASEDDLLDMLEGLPAADLATEQARWKLIHAVESDADDVADLWEALRPLAIATVEVDKQYHGPGELVDTTELAVLKVLDFMDGIVLENEDIVKELEAAHPDANSGQSSVKSAVKRLIDLGYARRPEGKSRGVVIEREGRKRLKNLGVTKNNPISTLD